MENSTHCKGIEAAKDAKAPALAPSKASRRAGVIIVCLAVFLVATVCVSLMLGRYPIEPGQAIAMLVN